MKKLIIITQLVITLVYTACESEIDFPIEQLQPTMVVYSILETDSVFKVHLSTSNKVTGTVEPNVLETAEVRIKDEDGQLFDLELVDYDGGLSKFYKSNGDHKPIPGKQYFMEAEHASMPSISATLLMPEIVELSNVKFSSDKFQIFEKDQSYSPYFPNAFFLPVRLTINDLPGENYYEICVIEEHLPWNYINQEGELMTSPGFSQRVDVFSYHPFLNSSDIKNWEGLEGNDDYRRGVLLFSDEPFDGKALEVEILAFTNLQFSENTLPYIDKANHTRFHIVLKHVSKGYYIYKETLRNYQENRNNSFVEPINVYSNVKNGLGVFLGSTSYKFALDPQNPFHY